MILTRTSTLSNEYHEGIQDPTSGHQEYSSKNAQNNRVIMEILRLNLNQTETHSLCLNCVY